MQVSELENRSSDIHVEPGVDIHRRRLVACLPALAAPILSTAWVGSAQARPAKALPVAKETLAAWLDALVPGAQAAGAADFVLAQLQGDRDKACLTLRYMDWPGSYRDFYEQGAAALNGLAQKRYGASFAKLKDSERHPLVEAVMTGRVEGWQGPPPPLFYFVSRADAVDVVYGTVGGFVRLSLPYRPHIDPSSNWPKA